MLDMVQVCRCERCLDQIMTIKLLGKKKLRNDLFKTIASYSQYLIYSDREKTIRFKTILDKIPVLPCEVLVAKRVVEDKSLKKHINSDSFFYLRMALLRMKYLDITDIEDINDISSFRRDPGFTGVFNDIYETMRTRYKKPFTIEIEELAIMFFSDYFKRCLNEKEEVEFMIKMLNRIFS